MLDRVILAARKGIDFNGTLLATKDLATDVTLYSNTLDRFSADKDDEGLNESAKGISTYLSTSYN